MLREAGVDPALLSGAVAQLRAALDAMTTRFFADRDGHVVETRELIAWDARLEAVKLVLGLIPQPRDLAGAGEVNIREIKAVLVAPWVRDLQALVTKDDPPADPG